MYLAMRGDEAITELIILIYDVDFLLQDRSIGFEVMVYAV
jgi:hypothetical protein